MYVNDYEIHKAHIDISSHTCNKYGFSAQVKFEAKVSKQKLGVNERLRVDFEMNQDGDNFNPPDFAKFTVSWWTKPIGE